MVVHPSSHRIPRVPWYSGYVYLSWVFVYRALTFCGRPSQTFLLTRKIIPDVLTPWISLLMVWPLPISLATTFGISFDFSSSAYLDVSVQRVPLINLWIQLMIHGMLHVGFPIRKSADRGSFAAPRSLSQLVTSFFGSYCQGILLALFFTWPYVFREFIGLSFALSIVSF